MSVRLKVKVLPNGEDLPLPSYATPNSAAVDLYAANPEDKYLEIKPGDVVAVPTGIALQVPVEYEAEIRPRSGMALNHAVTILNAPGTIDADYRGEIKVMLINLGGEVFVVKRGMRIAQMLLKYNPRIQMIKVDVISSTERNYGGFGSTGQ